MTMRAAAHAARALAAALILKHFQQKWEPPPQGNQFAGLISFPAAMRRIMRKNK
jgi:hypothetical protein